MFLIPSGLSSFLSHLSRVYSFSRCVNDLLRLVETPNHFSSVHGVNLFLLSIIAYWLGGKKHKKQLFGVDVLSIKSYEKRFCHTTDNIQTTTLTTLPSIIYVVALTRELRAFQGAWATPRSSKILEKMERSSARSICRGLVPRIFTPFKCNGTAKLLGIWPPTDTMLPEQSCRVEEKIYIYIYKLKRQRSDRGRRRSIVYLMQQDYETTFRPVASSSVSGHWSHRTKYETVGLVMTRRSVCVLVHKCQCSFY